MPSCVVATRSPLVIPPYDSPGEGGRRWREAGVDCVSLPVGAAAQGRGTRRWAEHTLLGRRVAQRGARVGRGRGARLQAQGAGRAGRRPALDREPNRACGRGGHGRREGPGGWNDDPRTGYSGPMRRFFAWQERYGLRFAHAWTVTSHALGPGAVGRSRPEPSLTCYPMDWPSLSSGVLTPHRAETAGLSLGCLYTRFTGVDPEEVLTVWRAVRELVPDATLEVIGRGSAGEESRLAAEKEST